MAGICQLPNELLAHIAARCDPRSALHLSATCRRHRTACYDSLVFREIITVSQRECWAQNTLDIDAIAARCGNDASAWLRYAIADHRASLLSQERADLVFAHELLHWAPELLAVKHPFMYHPCWRQPDCFLKSVSDKQLWCSILATLACEAADAEQGSFDMALAKKSISNLLESRAPPGANDTFAILPQELCLTILALQRREKVLLAGRLSSSEQQDGTRPTSSLFIFPRLSDIELRLEGSSDVLPLPFLDSLQGWSAWNSRHARALVDELTTGVWQGSYSFIFAWGHGGRAIQLDPPMTDIRFRYVATAPEHGREGIAILAEHCRDSVGIFGIRGSIVYQEDDTVAFIGTKQYYIGSDPEKINFEWNWSLKLTPFGLAGYWGRLSSGRLLQSGTVWLWKDARG